MNVKADLDIALIICPFWGVETPPIGLAYIDESVRRAGFKSAVLDLNLETYYLQPEDKRPMWRTIPNISRNVLQRSADLVSGMRDDLDDMADRILSLDAKVLGFSVNMGNLRFTRDLLDRLKSKGLQSTVILGGPFFYDEDQARRIVARRADYIVAGEGEAVLTDALKSMNSGKSLEGIPGLLEVGRTGLIRGNTRPEPKVIDYPFPHYEGFSLPDYTVGRLDVLSSRGCVRRCRFCNDWRYMGRYRTRPEQDVIDEMRFVRDHHGMNKVLFLDPVFNGDLERMRRLCRRIIEADLGIGWSAQMMVDTHIVAEDFALMKRAGCENVDIGLESGSDSVLKAMNKPYTNVQASAMIRGLSDAGIRPKINIIVGYPGETDADFGDTITFLEQHGDHLVGIGLLNTCLMNTDSFLDRNAKQLGLLMGRDNWAAATWADREGNTFDLRKRRARELKDTLERLGLPIDVDNVLWELDAEPQVISRQRIVREGIDMLKLVHRLDKRPLAQGPGPHITSYEIVNAVRDGSAWRCRTAEPLAVSVEAEGVREDHPVRMGVELWLSGFLVTRLLGPPVRGRGGKARSVLHIDSLELKPEAYTLVLTLEEQQADRTVWRDVRLCRDLEIEGDSLDHPMSYHLLRAKHYWTVRPLPADHQPHPRLGDEPLVTSVSADNLPAVSGGFQRLQVRVAIESRRALPDPKLFIEIYSNTRWLRRIGGFDLHAYPGHAQLPQGGGTVELIVPVMALGWGAYDLVASLYEDAQRKHLISEESLNRPFVVKTRPDRSVEGVLVPPYRWSVDSAPAPDISVHEALDADPLIHIEPRLKGLIERSYFDFDLHGIRYNSFESQAFILESNGRGLRVLRRWGPWSALPEFHEIIETTTGGLRWRLEASLERASQYSRAKAGLLLKASFKSWSFAGRSTGFRDRGHWAVIGPTGADDKAPLDEGYDLAIDRERQLQAKSEDASIALAAGPDAGVLRPIVQSDCHESWGLSVYGSENRILGSRVVLFDLLIDIIG